MAGSINSDLSKTFIREWENSLNQTLRIHQLEVGDVGCVVWDAALVLSAYLSTKSFSHHLKNSLAYKSICGTDDEQVNIIELGAGTGIVSIQAASLNPRYNVTVTDLRDLVSLMEKNVNENRSLLRGGVAVKALRWGVDTLEEKFDVILMADCIYYEESLPPLVHTLVDLSHENSLILCCYEARTEGKNPCTEKKFFELVQQHFTVEEIPSHEQDGSYQSPDIHLLKFTRKV